MTITFITQIKMELHIQGYNKGMKNTSRVEKVVTKVSIREKQSDYTYWQSQSYLSRLAALEEIRRDYHRWKFGAEPRLQRVYTIIKR